MSPPADWARGTNSPNSSPPCGPTAHSDTSSSSAGTPPTPRPLRRLLDVIRSGLLQQHGVRRVGMSGYPEGHPRIPRERLWSALEHKAAALAEENLAGDIITQFGFDADPALTWIENLRERGIDLPVRIGVPGPAGVRRLLSYAARFGWAPARPSPASTASP
ncbi:methylenetetrahydrofolate reductase [Streptomyces sp. M19]